MVYSLGFPPIILNRFVVVKSYRNIFAPNNLKEFCDVIFYESVIAYKEKNVVTKSSFTPFVETSKDKQ